MKRGWRKTAEAVYAGKLLHFAPNDGIYVSFSAGKEVISGNTIADFSSLKVPAISAMIIGLK